jgi:hypothetical protein
MADPKIYIRRSAAPGKVPTDSQLSLGELAVNTRDGKLYLKQDQTAVGLGSTVVAVNPWSVGVGTNSYNTYFDVGSVGIGTTNPQTKLQINGVLGFGTFTAFSQTVTNVRIGDNTTGAAITNGYNNFLIGVGAGKSITSGAENIFVGAGAGRSSTDAYSNVVMGLLAGGGGSVGGYNNIIGESAGYLNSGNYNNIFGFEAGYNNQGLDNVFIGKDAGYTNRTGGQNVFIGPFAGYQNISGFSNVFIGEYAGYGVTFGINNIVMGYNTLAGSAGGASYNVVLGYNAGSSLVGGNGNIFFGNGAADNQISGDNNIAIGNGIRLPKTNSGYQLAIGIKSDVTATKYWLVGNESFNVGIGTTNPTSKLTVNGDVNISGVVTASAFVGDGSLLTNLPSTGGGSSQWVTTSAGIHTLSNVGIGTTNPTVKLDVLGNVNVTGVITASVGVNAPFFINESTDDNNYYNIPFMTQTGVGGNAYRLLQVDNGGIRFNPGINALETQVVTSGVNGLLYLLTNNATKIGIVISPNNGEVGIGTTNPIAKLDVLGNANISGVITASSFSGNASSATYASSSGIATYATTAGIATYATSSGIATYASTSGIATYASSSGVSTYSSVAGISTYATTAGIATYATTSGIATYATSSGIATYASTSGIATYASTAGVSTYASTAGIATYATTAGIATYATTSGIATYATTAGISTYATSSGVSTYSSVAGISTYATTAGIATNLSATSSVNTTGIITATSYSGSGTNLTGIVTSISAGNGVSVDQSTGKVTITASTTDHKILDNISSSFNGSTTQFTISSGSVNFLNSEITSAARLLISVGGVVQQPDPTQTNGYYISGGTNLTTDPIKINFVEAPKAGQQFFGVAYGLTTSPVEPYVTQELSIAYSIAFGV